MEAGPLLLREPSVLAYGQLYERRTDEGMLPHGKRFLRFGRNDERFAHAKRALLRRDDEGTKETTVARGQEILPLRVWMRGRPAGMRVARRASSKNSA